ncbi:MAG: NUDIX hydrolase [Alphaproteobacteria bacterium]
MNELVLQNNSITTEIYNLISNIVPYDELEKEHITDTLSWIETGVPIFRIEKPDTPNKHLVSYFVLFNQNNKKILLVDHKKALLWLPSGGHFEPDEDPKEAARRECFEELQIEADFWIEDPIFLTSATTVGVTAGHTDVSLWYVLKGDSNLSYKFDREEFNDVKWFRFEEIPYGKSDPHMHRFIEKLKGYL